MEIWLCSPAWRRVAVTRLALAERRWLCDRLAAGGHSVHSVIVADDENLDVAREFGFETVEMDNSDLGAKFNAGFRFAAEQGAEVFVHVGSDDWIHPDVFKCLDVLDLSKTPEPGFIPEEGIIWRKAPLLISQRKATVVDLVRGKVQRCTVRGSHGCIPWLIPRIVMEACDFAPISPGRVRGMDSALVRGLKSRPNWVYQDAKDDWLVDFKTETNITPFRVLQHNIGRGDPVGLEDLRYPAFLKEMAQEVQEQLLEGVAA